MNTSQLRRKRIWIPAVAFMSVLGAGGAGIAVAANADGTQPLTGGERDSASDVALAEVGGGEVLEAETSDDRGEAFEIEVLDPDGVEWTVALDKDLAVVDRDRDDSDGRDDSRGDSDDEPVTGTEREEVEAAAVEEVGSGEATSVERSDDAGEAFDVEVVAEDGTVWDLALDDQLAVVQQERDDR